jgi:hypothetical protein
MLPYAAEQTAAFEWQAPISFVPIYVPDPNYAETGTPTFAGTPTFTGSFSNCASFGTVLYANPDATQAFALCSSGTLVGYNPNIVCVAPAMQHSVLAFNSEVAQTEIVAQSETISIPFHSGCEMAEVVFEQDCSFLSQEDAEDDETLDVIDAKSFVSSDASTSVAPARRRRGRRAAKSKVAQEAVSSLPISESPDPSKISLTEERKDELIRDLQAGGVARMEALVKISGKVLTYALEPFGTRVVQEALKVADSSQRQALARELVGHVVEAVCSPHANFVIQELINVLSPSAVSFVAEELSTCAADAARHRFACRVLCRLVEHHSSTSANSTSVLIDKILLQVEKLMHHNFARHVLQLILEHGSDDHRRRIASAIRNDIFRNAKSRYASYVVEEAIKRCSTVERDSLAAELLSDSDEFVNLAIHECGNHVVRAILMSHGSLAETGRELLLSRKNELQASKHGQRLLEEIVEVIDSW